MKYAAQTDLIIHQIRNVKLFGGVGWRGSFANVLVNHSFASCAVCAWCANRITNVICCSLWILSQSFERVSAHTSCSEICHARTLGWWVWFRHSSWAEICPKPEKLISDVCSQAPKLPLEITNWMEPTEEYQLKKYVSASERKSVSIKKRKEKRVPPVDSKCQERFRTHRHTAPKHFCKTTKKNVLSEMAAES